jgi:putative heme-binding domain-containing protein
MPNRAALLLVALTLLPPLARAAAAAPGAAEPPKAPGPPVVQMLVPGFTVRELPVELNNLTGVRYGPGGRLYGIGYDGRIHVLSDTDGDGLEDRVEAFWDEQTFRTPMAMTWGPDGQVYVVANGKVSRLIDEDKDGKPDREEVFSTGWVPDAGNTGGGVDAVGLAFDRDGNLYFGLGVANYANAYLIDEKTGRSHYDLKSERGTILRVSPDGKKREIVCTGIRFPIGLAFNRHGDLFCTDQEGETWLPGGNPLDELNHILPGRHYGFPPRDDKLLPGVADEPPVAGYGPQHQSTCGLIFNEARPGQKNWGPKAWEDDAIVAGFGRGKLWRTKLVKSPSGYVSRTWLVAALRMLTVDSAISPSGDLVVACHSGEPDWGTGPQGKGKLFKIAYTDPAASQPVVAWAASPVEVHVAFDRPVDPSLLDLGNVRIDYGQHVRAGDRFEVLKPPYKAVEAQGTVHRGQLRVASASLSKDRRTVVLTTDPHPAQASYAVSIPFGKTAADGQAGVVELDYDLAGLDVEWTAKGATQPAWSGWLPGADLAAAAAFLDGSAAHAQLKDLLAKPGTLRLAGELRTKPGPVSMRVASNVPFEIHCGGSSSSASASPGGRVSGSLAFDVRDAAVPFEVKLKLPGGGVAPAFYVSYKCEHDAHDHPLPAAWQFPSWAPQPLPAPTAPPEPAPELAGGDWKRGEALFSSDEAKCATCHTIRGKGGQIGPDLSNLPHRDAASILRDIVKPNAVIHPDHLSYIAVTKDKQVLTGLVRSDRADRLRLYDTAGKETVLDRADVVTLKAGSISIMPDGYEALGAEKLKDLIAFLQSDAPPAAAALADNPPKEEGNKAPPPRRRSEVEAVIGKLSDVFKVDDDAEAPRRLRVLLVAGPKDHGPGEHDYPAWQKAWEPLMKKAPGVEVATAFGRPTPEQWQNADLAVFYCWGGQFWGDDLYQHLDPFLARGGGLVVLHSAVIPDDNGAPKLADRIGLAYPTTIKFRHGPMDLKTFAAAADHPVMRGLEQVHFVDESYWPHVGDVARVRVLATTPEEGEERPMVWTHEPAAGGGKGRVFATILGHYAWTFDDPLARVLILRGMAWAAGEPVDRFAKLSVDGVKMLDE